MLGRATRHRGQRAIVAALGDPFFYTTGLPAGVSSPLASQIDSATPGPNRQCCLNRIIPAGKYGCVLRRSSQLFARTSLTDQRRYNTCGQSTFAMLTRRAAVGGGRSDEYPSQTTHPSQEFSAVLRRRFVNCSPT